MAATLEDIRVKNRQLAASNLAQQGAIAEARNQLAVVRSSEYQVRDAALRAAHTGCIGKKPHARRQRRSLAGVPGSLARSMPPAVQIAPPAPAPPSRQAIRARFDHLLARQARVASVLGSATFRERLEDAVSAADAASSELSGAFLGGGMGLDAFVEAYIDARTRHHALDLKLQAAEGVLGTQ